MTYRLAERLDNYLCRNSPGLVNKSLVYHNWSESE